MANGIDLMKLSVAIPCYNEAAAIEKAIDAVLRALCRIVKYNVCVCGSKDPK